MSALSKHLEQFREQKMEEFHDEGWRQDDALVLAVQDACGLTLGFLPDADDYVDYANDQEQSYKDGTALAYEVGVLHGIHLARLELERLPWYKRFLFF